MEHARQRPVALAHGLLALLVLLTGAACATPAKTVAPPAPSISAVPTDPEVTATGLPDGVDVELTDSSPGVESGDNVDFVSPVYTVSAIGPFAVPATFTLRLDNALPESTPVLVVTRKFERDPWTYQRGRLSEDLRHVVFRASMLDQVAVLSIDSAGALPGFRADIRSRLFTGRATKATEPTCEGSAEALTSGYATNASENKTLYWCFGLRKDKRVLTVTNRRGFPVEITVGTTRTSLAPGRSATYDAELAPEATLKLVASSTVQARSLRVLQATSRALVKRLNSFGAGPVRPAATLQAFLGSSRCAAALKAGVDSVARRCFTTAALVKVFGSRALLLEPLTAGQYTPVFFDRLDKRLTAEAKAQRERVYVHRKAADFAGLVGLWSGTTRLLNVTAAGVVTERLEDSKKALVIQLTYQLEDPVTNAGITTADATLTKVSVGNRKLLNGRVPKVGDTGRISLAKGVITPPFLKTKYCDAAASRKGTCQ